MYFVESNDNSLQCTLFPHKKRDSLQAELQIHYQKKCKKEQEWRDEDHHKDTLSIVIHRQQKLYIQLK